jgi:hypothetical protein
MKSSCAMCLLALFSNVHQFMQEETAPDTRGEGSLMCHLVRKQHLRRRTCSAFFAMQVGVPSPRIRPRARSERSKR